MKKIVSVIFIFIVLMLPILSIAAYPEELEETNHDGLIELISEEPMDTYDIVEDDVYEIAQDVVMNKMIDGNVYVISQNLKIENATIYGNVYVIAEKIEIENSQINGSVYAMGETIHVSGTINDFYATGNQINLNEDSAIWRSARIGANHLNVKGNIGRDLYASVENINIVENAKIDGKVKYFSKTQGNISENAQIKEVQFEQKKQEDTKSEETNIMNYLYEAARVAFQTLFITLIIVFGINKFKTLKRTNNVAMDFLKDTGKGALLLIFVPIISILLMISIIGMGFGFVMLALYIIFVYISIPITSIEITHRILKKAENTEIKKGKMIGISILISLTFWLINFVPVIGGIIRFIAILIGLGVLFTLIFQKNKKEEINEN